MTLKLIGKNAIKFVLVVMILGIITACSSEQSSSDSDSNSDDSSTNNSENQGDGSSDNSKEMEETISIGTPPVGATYNTVGSGLAKVISENSKIKVSVKPSQGPSAWGPQLNEGQIQLGVGSGPDLAWAFKGINGYQEPMKNLRLLVRGNYLTATGLAVRKNSDIEKVADVKGKRVATYPGAAIGQMLVEATLVANGLTWDDVEPVPIPSLFEGMEALQDRTVDAAFAMTPNTPVSQQVNSQVGLRGPDILDDYSAADIAEVPENLKEEITSRIPGVELTVAKPFGYLTEETLGIKYPAEMVSSSNLSEAAAYEIMQTIWDNYEKLKPVHKWLETWTPEQMFDPTPTLPYHPGAVKFYKDKGIWTEEVDAIQQELLKEAGS
ncbi:TAXI family TRAP transporter solute-binding subunit [Terrihalobacillus insolitus]|uniref:TAXI family TRAP transporter solute-binding subunit n=1 Tax=Terrihalobacillus insolitus TaxID=2950438 RepID=UPI002341243D|nr:TAXI family TRAP transporter solute-binding subunit [Terrihalobacillus insolitus]MDC3411902.1 TAXI family TRAP transporter solute-binding subunit [Terrihalobacillus insolitus]